MRGLYGYFVATIGFMFWICPLLLIGFGVYRLYYGAISGLIYGGVGLVLYFALRRIAAGLVQVGDSIVSDELRKRTEK